MSLLNNLNKLKGQVGSTKLKAAYVGATKVWSNLDGIIFAMYKLRTNQAPHVWAINADNGNVEYTIPMKTSESNSKLFYANDILFHAGGSESYYYVMEFEYSTDKKEFIVSKGFISLYLVMFSNNKWYYLGCRTSQFSKTVLLKSDTFLGAVTEVLSFGSGYNDSYFHFFEYNGVPYIKANSYIYNAETGTVIYYHENLSYGGATVTDENNLALYLSSFHVKIIRNFPSSPEDSTSFSLPGLNSPRLTSGNGILVGFDATGKRFVIINSSTTQITFVPFSVHVDKIYFSKKAKKFFFVTGEANSTAIFMTTDFMNNIEVLRGNVSGVGTFTLSSNDNLM